MFSEKECDYLAVIQFMLYETDISIEIVKYLVLKSGTYLCVRIIAMALHEINLMRWPYFCFVHIEWINSTTLMIIMYVINVIP